MKNIEDGINIHVRMTYALLGGSKYVKVYVQMCVCF